MSEKDLITIFVSALALVVSIYGIFERNTATRRALRIRLTELIDDLAKMDGEEQVYAQDASKSDTMKAALRNSNATRRALLAAQAVDILSKYRKRVTVPEYHILASALHDTSDTSGQRSVLAQAILDLSGETPFQQAVAWRAWAWFNFERGDTKNARRAIRRSLDASSPTDDVGRHERLVSLFGWFDYEFHASDSDAELMNRILDQAEALAMSVTRDEWRDDAIKRVLASRATLHSRSVAGALPKKTAR